MPTFEQKIGDYGEKIKKLPKEVHTPFGYDFDRFEKGKKGNESNDQPYSYNIERKEERGYFNTLKTELETMQGGGGDRHLGYFDVGKLSDKALDFYREFKKNKLDEKELDEYISMFPPGDNEYNFIAFLRTWILDKKQLNAEKEKEKLKEEARRKLEELKKNNPHVVAHIDNINLDSLRRLDLKVISNIDQINLGDYRNNLKEYFGNKTKGKQEQELKIIKDDPRFDFYCSLKGILNLEPGKPEEFIK
jgi:hypothetical protein